MGLVAMFSKQTTAASIPLPSHIVTPRISCLEVVTGSLRNASEGVFVSGTMISAVYVFCFNQVPIMISICNLC